MSIIWNVDMNQPGATIWYIVIYFLCENFFWLILFIVIFNFVFNANVK